MRSFRRSAHGADFPKHDTAPQEVPTIYTYIQLYQLRAALKFASTPLLPLPSAALLRAATRATAAARTRAHGQRQIVLAPEPRVRDGAMRLLDLLERLLREWLFHAHNGSGSIQTTQMLLRILLSETITSALPTMAQPQNLSRPTTHTKPRMWPPTSFPVPIAVFRVPSVFFLTIKFLCRLWPQVYRVPAACQAHYIL